MAARSSRVSVHQRLGLPVHQRLGGKVRPLLSKPVTAAATLDVVKRRVVEEDVNHNEGSVVKRIKLNRAKGLLTSKHKAEKVELSTSSLPSIAGRRQRLVW